MKPPSNVKMPAQYIASLPADRVKTIAMVRLADVDFVSGGLNQNRRVRPNRLFTADVGIIVYRAGRVSEAKLNEVVERLIVIIKGAAI